MAPGGVENRNGKSVSTSHDGPLRCTPERGHDDRGSGSTQSCSARPSSTPLGIAGTEAAAASSAAEPATGDGGGADGSVEAEPATPKKPKGHGRNGASAFTRAKHFFYALAAGVIGATCEACGFQTS